LHIPKKSVLDENIVDEILSKGKYTTIALSDGNDSYVLSLFYGYDPDIETLYFKSTRSGTKFDFLRSNAYVTGTVILNPENLINSDLPSYSSVVFRGLVEVIHNQGEIDRALSFITKKLPSSCSASVRTGENRINSNPLIMKLKIDEKTGRGFNFS